MRCRGESMFSGQPEDPGPRRSSMTTSRHSSSSSPYSKVATTRRSRVRGLLGSLHIKSSRWLDAVSQFSTLRRANRFTAAWCGHRDYLMVRSLISGALIAGDPPCFVGTPSTTPSPAVTPWIHHTSAAASAVLPNDWSSTMPDIITAEHQWVAISVQPVHVLQDDIDNEPVIFADPDHPARTQYGCDCCGEILDSEIMVTPCAGPPLDE